MQLGETEPAVPSATDARPGITPARNAEGALARARDHLLALQKPDGHWRGLLETNVTMDAEDLLLREFLGITDRERSRRAASWIRSKQGSDGSWANFAGGPGDLSTTIEAYWALRVAGDEPSAPHMQRAAAWSREHGGPRQARVFTHIWMALFGLWPWDEVPAIPPELMFLPRWFPLNPYDFSCWARQTIVALMIVRAHRPSRQLAFTLEELGPSDPAAVAPAPSLAGRMLNVLDRVMRVYERHPLRPLRRAALTAAERWVVKRQEADGGWGGIQPPWVYALMALHLQGYPLEHPVIRAGLAGLDCFTVEDGDAMWLEACQSPVWDTALAILALADAGLKSEDPALVRGEGCYVDDLRLPGTLFATFVRSPYAHARVLSVDVSAALSLPGVVAASLGARLVQSDRQAGALDVCRLNGERNGVPSIEYRSDDWTAWAQANGISGTPAFVFNNRFLMVGAQDYPVFADVARRNVTQFFEGKHPAWQLTVGDLAERLPEDHPPQTIDRIVLDMLAVVEELGVGKEPDEHENPGHWEWPRFPGFYVLQGDPGHLAVQALDLGHEPVAGHGPGLEVGEGAALELGLEGAQHPVDGRRRGVLAGERRADQVAQRRGGERLGRDREQGPPFQCLDADGRPPARPTAAPSPLRIHGAVSTSG